MSMEEMLKNIMANQVLLAISVRNNQLATQHLEEQFGQMAIAQNSQPQGVLPGNTNLNPKQANMVGTSSDLLLEELAPKKRKNDVVSKESKPKEGEVNAQ